MRDGTVLRAGVYRPENSEKHPTILFRTPYSKLLAINNDFMNLVDFTFAGYVLVIQDIRGRFSSEGVWEKEDLFKVEGYDGYDSVEWVTSQSWCDGNVAMAGGSYMGFLAWIADMENPPHLRAMQ